MHNIKAVIFDLDGVLVDAAKYHYLAWKRLAEELSIEFSLEANERLKDAEALKVSPNQCIVFEDAESGVEAAINAGMHCIGIGSKNILNKAHLVLSGFPDMTFDKSEL